MSNINVNGIDANFPIQGRDNNSQGFRNNFLAIKTALNLAKIEITELETNSARNNANNNFGGNKIENVLLNNISYLYKNKGIPEDQQISLDVKDAQVFRVRCIGDTTIRFTNWPQNTVNIEKNHSIKLHVAFDLDPADTNLLNYKINFSTDLGGEIKSFTTGAPWTFVPALGGWHLKPYKNNSVSNDYNSYEHVFEAWSYSAGQNVFIRYLGSFA